MENIEQNVEKSVSFFKKIGNWYYSARVRKEKIDTLIKQYESLITKNQELKTQDTELMDQILNIMTSIQGIEKEMTRLDDINADIKDVKKGLQKSLLFTLRNLHEELVYKRKWATASEKKEFCETYKAYHKLGENGVADSYFKEVMALPERHPGDD